MKLKDLNLNPNVKLLPWQSLAVEKIQKGEVAEFPHFRRAWKSYLFLYLWAEKELESGKIKILKHEPEKSFISICAWCRGKKETHFEKLLKRLWYEVSHGICETCEF